MSVLVVVPVLAALIGIIAVYQGGRGSTRVHLIAALAGATVILCISVLPFVALSAFSSFGGTSSRNEPIFIAYFMAVILSVSTELACSLRLASHRRRS